MGLSASSLKDKARQCREVSFSGLFDRCMSPSQRVAHVSDTVERLLSTQTRDMHAVMNSCGHDNPFGVHVNSRGAVGHRNSCNSHAADLRGEMKAFSTSTRCKVGRPAGKELAPLQQAPEELHVETWGPVPHMVLACGFPRRWKSFRGVLFRWLVLHVLITLLCHLDQAE